MRSSSTDRASGSPASPTAPNNRGLPGLAHPTRRPGHHRAPPPRTRPPPSAGPTTTAPTSEGPAITAPPPTVPQHRTPTAAHPLRVLFAGDSLVGNISQGVAKFIGDDPRIDLLTDVQVGTGLSRPDILDWGAELAQQLKRIGPDVVFLAFGGN